MPIEDIFEWTEYRRFDQFKSRVLLPLHADRLLEWDRETDTAILSPIGVHHVEDDILRSSD